jgi:flavin reductase (DIM6/NTAB) family NADH-FMN oxidoreductase RutF
LTEINLGKNIVSGQEGLLAFPGFPLILVVVNDNIITVAATSFFSFDPPMVMIGIVPSRYTFELIQNSEDYTINIPTEDLLPAVRICGSKSGRDVNKWELTDLTPENSKIVQSLIIKECPVNLECKIVEKIQLNDSSHVWFIGEILTAHIQPDYDRSKALMYWPREYRRVGSVIKK